MRIAYFTDTYEPQINGVVTSIKLTAEILRERGHEVYIFCPSGSKKRNVFPVFSVKFKNYPEYRIGLPSFELIGKIKEIKPDIIHVHTPVSIGMTGLALAKSLSIPSVVTYHTILKNYMNYVISDHELFTNKYTAWFFNKFSSVIVPTKSIESLLRKNGIKKPIKVLPTPINIDLINNKPKRKNKKLTILHVGRLCKEKRIDMILYALKDVLKKLDAVLIITSRGPDEKRLKELAKKLNIIKNVKFTGFVSESKLRELYSSSDVFVSASDTETQGLVLLEAMANGCPVIARDATGFKDVVENGKNGFLFRSKEELSEKLITLSKNKKLREKMIKEGLKTADKFSPENYVKEVEKIYKENLRVAKVSVQKKILYDILLFIDLLFFGVIRKMKLFVFIGPRFISFVLNVLRMFI